MFHYQLQILGKNIFTWTILETNLIQFKRICPAMIVQVQCIIRWQVIWWPRFSAPGPDVIETFSYIQYWHWHWSRPMWLGISDSMNLVLLMHRRIMLSKTQSPLKFITFSLTEKGSHCGQKCPFSTWTSPTESILYQI